MKHFIKVVIIFALALAVAGFSHFNSGFVTIAIANYQLEFSLNLLLVMWLVSFLIIYYLLRIIINVKRIPAKLQRSRQKRSLILGQKYLNLAGLYYFEGRYKNCYKFAIKTVKQQTSADNKFLAYMLALRSASIMQDAALENKVVDEIAQFSEPKWQLAKHMILAENLYNEQQYGQCIDNLQAALQLDFKHIPSRRMLLKVYLYLGNYHKAYEVLEWLLKHDSLREYKANRYKARVLGGLFAEIGDAEELSRIYRRLEKSEQSSFLYAKIYFDALLRVKDYQLALDFLIDHAKDESLQLIYPDAILALARKLDNSAGIERLLTLTEKYLAKNTGNSGILLALGILSYRKQLWGKARSYLDSSLNLKVTLDGLTYLSMLAEETADSQLLSDTQRRLINDIQKFK